MKEMINCESCDKSERIEDLIKVTNLGTFCMRCINSGVYKMPKSDRIESVKYWDTLKTNELKKYNIDSKEYDRLYTEQKGACAICKRHQSKIKKVLCVDHCHKTGKVRGLLCNHCNSLLGFSRDNTETLNNAIYYLNNSKNDL